MKLDLHLHTPSSSINGDSIKWESTSSAVKKMFDNNVGAFSFTDHNRLNVELYFEARNFIKNKMIIFPGVEVDVINENGNRAHCIVIFDNTLSDNELTELSRLLNKKLRKNGITFKVFNELFDNKSTIKIPHIGKSDFFEVEDLEKFNFDAIEITNHDHPNFKKWISKKNDKSIVAFSDTHIWTSYPQNNFLTTNIEFDGTFANLKQKLLEKKDFSERKYKND